MASPRRGGSFVIIRRTAFWPNPRTDDKGIRELTPASLYGFPGNNQAVASFIQQFFTSFENVLRRIGSVRVMEIAGAQQIVSVQTRKQRDDQNFRISALASGLHGGGDGFGCDHIRRRIRQGNEFDMQPGAGLDESGERISDISRKLQVNEYASLLSSSFL